MDMPEQMREWMRAAGFTTVAVAAHLGMEQSTLHRYLTGARPMPDDLPARVDTAIRAMALQEARRHLETATAEAVA